MVSPKWFIKLLTTAVAFSVASVSVAQVPNDVNNPVADATPLLNGGALIRPQDLAVLQFDSLLDPSNGADAARMTAAAQSIITSHKIAQQQVELAILYLRSNEQEIIAGKNTFFNSIYGKNSVKQKVAILAPVPLPGSFNLVSSTLLRATAQQGGGGGGGNNQGPRISVSTLLNAGDSLYLPGPTSNVGANNNQVATNNFSRTTYPNLSTTPGYVVRIAAVIKGGLQGQGGGGGGGQNNQSQNTDFILDPNFSNSGSGAQQAAVGNLTAWRIIRFETRDDPTIYNQVLATYIAIREALAGFDPSLASRAAQTQNRIQYSRRFQSIGPQISSAGVATPGFYAYGQGDFTQLDSLVQTNLGISNRGADRLVREAGLSLSDSLYHIDRLDDLGDSAITQDRRKQQITPLLWTEDNDLPLTYDNYNLVPGSTNEDRAYFRDRQTIFGDYLDDTNYTGDGIYNQFVGRAFLEQLLNHAGDFAGVGIAATDTTTVIRQTQRPAGSGILQFTPATVNSPATPIFQTIVKPESGTPTTGKTLQKWQMILSSFAEWSDNPVRSKDPQNKLSYNSAFGGLMNLTGGGGLPSLRASDSGNYAGFAGLLDSTTAGGIDFNRIEPIGKRGNAGFNPVVPAN